MRVFKLTNDDWYPSYKLNGWHKGQENEKMVEVSILPLKGKDTRVCVWGGDDFGLERDFEVYTDALAIFLLIIQEDYVDKNFLFKLEFKGA